MIPDSNSLINTMGHMVNASFSGDTTLLGIFFILLIAFVFVKGKVKASTALAIGANIAFVLMLINNYFEPIFWILGLIAILMLIKAIRTYFISQS